VILDSEAFDELVDVADEVADEGADRSELRAARAEDDSVPWDEGKVALGLR
jgi:hypothetical protein